MEGSTDEKKHRVGILVVYRGRGSFSKGNDGGVQGIS